MPPLARDICIPAQYYLIRKGIPMQSNGKSRISADQLCADLALFVLFIIQFVTHRFTPFMMDDFWYSTNLATGEPLDSFMDIIEGQIWHYLNWGGRSITHGILQLTLMSGEFAADIINMSMTLLLSYMICILCNKRDLFTFGCAAVLTVSLNANVQYSMVWQAGVVNYVYSTVWILAFLRQYLRALEQPQAPALPLCTWWMIPLGLITGWSNENMGPACFAGTVMVMIYVVHNLKEKLPLWMLTGSISSLLGSILVILAPGNFVRSATIAPMSLGETLYARLFSMLRAGTDYLFPSVLFMTVLILIYTFGMKQKLIITDYLLLAIAVLSYGAMALSPHYPDRATFGTMVLCIILILRLINRILILKPLGRKAIYAGMASLWLFALLTFLNLLLWMQPVP